jgi:hypothetical protein
MHIPALLPFATDGRNDFEEKKPISSVRPSNAGIIFASGSPIPKKIAL